MVDILDLDPTVLAKILMGIVMEEFGTMLDLIAGKAEDSNPFPIIVERSAAVVRLLEV